MDTVQAIFSYVLVVLVHPLVTMAMGLILGVMATIRTQRPRLVRQGEYSGSAHHGRAMWGISVSNRPSFLGMSVHGEAALDVVAQIQPDRKGGRPYILSWQGESRDVRASIQPWEEKNLELFVWIPGTRGYSVLDHSGEAIARFDEGELRFVVTFMDRLERTWAVKLTVLCDPSSLHTSPALQLSFHRTWAERWESLRASASQFREAFR